MHALDIFTPLPSPSDISACVVSISLEMPAACRKQVGRVSHLTWRENMENSVCSGSPSFRRIGCFLHRLQSTPQCCNGGLVGVLGYCLTLAGAATVPGLSLCFYPHCFLTDIRAATCSPCEEFSTASHLRCHFSSTMTTSSDQTSTTATFRFRGGIPSYFRPALNCSDCTVHLDQRTMLPPPPPLQS